MLKFTVNLKSIMRYACVLVMATTALTSCNMQQRDAAGNVQIGDDVPTFYLKSPDGTTVGSDDLKGRQPYVVAVFATWCPPCKMELKAFEKELWEPLKDSNIGVYGINYGDETADQIQQFAQELGVTFPLLIDEPGEFRKAVGVQGVPTSFVVGKDGKIMDIHLGFTDEGVASIKKQLMEEAE
jgi:peroxiredoxin